MRSVLLSSVLVTVLLPPRGASADEHDAVPKDPPSPSACVQALKQCGASLHIADDGRVLGVGMPATATDSHLLPLRGLTEIEQLYVACPKVTDRGLANVKCLARLRTLNLNQTQITDGGLTNLKDLRGLRSLYLDASAITDAAMIRLADLEMLRVLSLRNTRITDKGIRHLHALKHLRVIHLKGTGVTADGAFHLRGAIPGVDVAADLGDSPFARKRLKELGAKLEIREGVVISVDMETQRVVDKGLQLLSGLCGLKRLSLVGVTLNTEHISSLARLTDLQSLDLVVHKKIPHEDYKRLCRAMRNASIDGSYVPPPLDKPTGGGVTTVSLRLSSAIESVPWLQLPEGINDTVFRCSYYQGTRGKESIPVIVLHEWGGSSRDLEPYARRLQKDGCAVIVPELWPGIDCSRPHDGRSRDRKWMERNVFLDLGCAQLAAVYCFLEEEHNKGVLNLSLACILAEGYSGFLAANCDDWMSMGLLAFDSPNVNMRTPSLLDTDVVFRETDADPVDTDPAHGPVLVLLSPQMLRAYSNHYLLRPTSSAAATPTILVVGAKSKKSLIAAREVYQSLKLSYQRYRSVVHRARSTTDQPEAPSLIIERPSSKQGAALINEDAALSRQIADFIDKFGGLRRLASPWKIRVTSTLESAFESK